MFLDILAWPEDWGFYQHECTTVVWNVQIKVRIPTSPCSQTSQRRCCFLISYWVQLTGEKIQHHVKQHVKQHVKLYRASLSASFFLFSTKELAIIMIGRRKWGLIAKKFYWAKTRPKRCNGPECNFQKSHISLCIKGKCFWSTPKKVVTNIFHPPKKSRYLPDGELL